MTSTTVMREKFSNVRKKLDQLGYRQPLGVDSLPLAERLLSDLVWTTESLRKTKADLDKRMEVRGKVEECIEPYKSDNAKLVRENNDLHQRMMAQRQEAEESVQDLKSRLRHIEAENDDLKFFNTQCLHKIKTFEKDVKAMADKIILLQEKNFQAVVHTPGGRKKTIPFRRQRMDIDCMLPEADPSLLPPGPEGECCTVAHAWSQQGRLQGNPEQLSVVEMAGGRCEELANQIRRHDEEVELLDRKVDNFRSQVAFRDKEISRLNMTMEGGRPLEVVAKESKDRSNDRLITQLNLQLDLLQQRNDELERDIATLQSVSHKKESLANGNISSTDHTFEEADTEEDEIAKDKEVADIVQEIQRSRDKLLGMQKERLELEETLADNWEGDNRELQELLDTFEEDNRRVVARIEYLTTQQRDLVGMERRGGSTRVDGAESRGKVGRMEVYMRGVEDDRDYWRSEAQLLTRMVRQMQQSRGPTAAPTSTANGHRSAKAAVRGVSTGKKVTGLGVASKKEKAVENQLRVLADERDAYKRELDALRQKHRSMSPANGRPPSRPRSVNKEREELDNNRDSSEVKRLRDERDSLQNLLDKFERQVHDIQGNVRVLTQERDSINKLYEDTRGELAKVRQELLSPPKATATSSKVSLAAQTVLRRVEAEREDAIADLRRMTTERDSLRERLHTATESGLSEKARLEQRAEDATREVKRVMGEREESAERVTALRVRVGELEEEINIMNRQVTDRSEEMDSERRTSQQLRMQVEGCQQRMEKSERHAAQLDSELHEAADRTKILQERLTTLEKELKTQREECGRFRSTVSQLDHEKDSLQSCIDERTERLSTLEAEVRDRDQTISDLRVNLTTGEQQVSRAQEASSAHEREVRSLRKQVQQQAQELSQERRRGEQLVRENGRLQDDLTTMTRENQALQAELQETAEDRERGRAKVQELTAQIKMTEENMGHKDQERTSLLEQYRLLSLEADRHQTQSHTLESELSSARMEAMSRDQEMQRLQERAAGLESDIQEQQDAMHAYESQVSTLTRSISELEDQLRFQQKEKAEAIQDVCALRDLCSRLESGKEAVQRQLTSASLEVEQLRASMEEAGHDQDAMREQMSAEVASVRNLETVLTTSREKEFQTQLEVQERSAEINMLKDRLELNETKVDQQHREVTRLRTRNTELEAEVERLHRQVTSERFEKERAVQETRRYQQHQISTVGESNLYRPHSQTSNPGTLAATYSGPSQPSDLHPSSGDHSP